MVNKAIVLSLLVFVVSACINKPSPNPYSGPLKPYLSCEFDDGLSIVTIDRREPTSDERTVSTEKGEEMVSVVDGFRLGLAYGGRSYLFANLKIEQSDPTHFENDKKMMLSHLKSLSDFESMKLDSSGYHVYGVEATEIDNGGVIGMYTFFSEEDQVIVTVYLLNQEEHNRKFNDISEFRQLRTCFLRKYTECINNNRL